MKPMKDKISLHGLGFVQVPLAGNDDRRLHVWHPSLPRRSCWAHSAVHDHRFGFNSLVLVGTQINVVYNSYTVTDALPATHIPYLHEGDRTEFGNRPWIPQDPINVREMVRTTHPAGTSYNVLPYVFHSTEPGGDGRVATIMTKTAAGGRGAQSLCEVGIEPDINFNRRQWDNDRLWAIVRDVLEA